MTTYWYEGRCPQTGALRRLPRTAIAETAARELMRDLARDDQYAAEGKMYGILLVETATGEHRTLKAFSGLLNRQSTVDGWVPPIPGRDQIVLQERQTLAHLNAIRDELRVLQQLPDRQHYVTQRQVCEQQRKELRDRHRQRKAHRDQQRQRLHATLTGESLAIALEQLNNQSRQDGIERRRLIHHHTQILTPLIEKIDQVDHRIRQLKQQRKERSRTLQAQMHTAYQLTNFEGTSLPLHQISPSAPLPTGTGDCCAPKLLHYAAIHRLKPIAMAEFWWGPSTPNGDKVQGQFYGACAERCQPIMGFLLSGLSSSSIPLTIQTPTPKTSQPIAILYEDDHLIAVNKPAGLLSVPGRYLHTHDSVLSRLRQQQSTLDSLTAIHRLDQDTSGILLLAKDRDTHRQLSRQFQTRQVHKVYEAILSGRLDDRTTPACGEISLPLWSDPGDRPRQKVDDQQGRPSMTRFQVLGHTDNATRIQFIPLTGRTHQLRVHAAHPRGLGLPILGDRLYGSAMEGDRLYLHAKEIRFYHPHQDKDLYLKTETPF